MLVVPVVSKLTVVYTPSSFAISELKRLGVLHSHCVAHPGSKLPTSCVVLNMSTASRTIVHYRCVIPLVAVTDEAVLVLLVIT